VERSEEIRYLTDFQQMQIKMAAAGCISGYLEEWPFLFKALQDAKQNVHRRMRGHEVSLLCRRLLGEQSE